MRQTSYRLCGWFLALLLAISACTAKTTLQPTLPPSLVPLTQPPESSLTPQPGTDTPVPATPQSTISNPQATFTPTSTTTLQSTISNQQSTLNNPQYHLAARLNYNLHSLAVTETITYTNSTSQTLTDLLLVVAANRYPGAFQLKVLRLEGGEATQDFGLRLHRLTVILPQPLPPGEQVTLDMEYDLALPPIPEPSDAAPQPFGYTLAQTNLVDWYAYIPPYLDGWQVNDPGFWGEYQVFQAADYRVELTLENAPEGMVVAASAALLESTGGMMNTYRYRLDSARTFVLSISPSYQVMTQQVDLEGRSVTVYSYAYAYNLEAAQRVLEDTARALELYSEVFGEYPRDTLSVVEADFLDGMEYDGLYFLSKGFYNLYDGTPNGYLTAIAVHETAHQWWYGLVGNDQAQEPWLDEALCTFTERLYYERYYPQALSAWWQPYRVNYYEPRGLVGQTIYDYSSYRDYRDGVYLHGEEFLQAMREQMGDEAFFAALREYIIRYRERIATGQDLLAILAEHSQVEISDLVEEYFGK